MLRRELTDTAQQPWSEWVHAIHPVVDTKTNWFKRDTESLNLRVLPTHTGGVYEMAITLTKDSPKIGVYVGKAEGVSKQSKGCSLRTRIFGQYALKGSHKGNELRAFLEVGCHVWFRWLTLQTKTACRELETQLIQSFDYPLNIAQSTQASRGYSGVVCEIGGQVVNVLEHLKPDNKKEEKVDVKVKEVVARVLEVFDASGIGVRKEMLVVRYIFALLNLKLQETNHAQGLEAITKAE
jgi:hypothetical protein